MNKNLLKVVKSLGLNPDEEAQFISCLENERAARPAIIWTRQRAANTPFYSIPINLVPLGFNQKDETGSDPGLNQSSSHNLNPNESSSRLNEYFEFIDMLSTGQNPGSHKLHEEGEIYCLDFSSVFAVSVLAEARWEGERAPRLVVDTCSSPGGKAVYAWRAIKPERLICNEVIGSRISALISNIKRCSITPTIVTNADTAHLAASLSEMADLVLVDAPCSGQSLPAKGGKAVGAFHPSTINMNSNRQKRILANAAKLVAPGGYIAYMTCTFSKDENEGVIKWFLKRFPSFEPLVVPHLERFRSSLTDLSCYRLFPHQGLGAGAFTCLLRRKPNEEDDTSSSQIDWTTFKCIWRNDLPFGTW